MPPKKKGQSTAEKLIELLRQSIPANASINQSINQSSDEQQSDAPVKPSVPITSSLISAMHQFVIYGTDEGYGVNPHEKKAQSKKQASSPLLHVIDPSEIPTQQEVEAFHQAVLKLPILAAVAAVLTGPQNERVQLTIFTQRSLALCCLGRLITFNADLKQSILTTYPQLIPLIVDALHEKSPFTHHAALNLLVEFSSYKELTPMIKLPDLALILSIYEFHCMVDVSKRGSDTIDAQMGVRVFAMAFLANFCAIGGIDLVSKTEAVGFAVQTMHTDTQRDLLIQALKLIYLMFHSSEQLRQQTAAQLGNIGYVLALTGHPDEHISTAAKIVLAQTPLGARAARGETGMVDKLTVEEMVVYESRLKQIQPPAVRKKLEEEYQEYVTAQQMSFPSQQSQQDTFVNHQCARCGVQEPTEESAKKFAVCSQCKGARYCSKECQVAHWKQGHKTVCKKSVQ